jgi:hypothetical protein
LLKLTKAKDIDGGHYFICGFCDYDRWLEEADRQRLMLQWQPAAWIKTNDAGSG